MKEIGKVVTDWRHGYEIIKSFQDHRYAIAFATPHSMMSEPRIAEVSNLKISFMSERLNHNSEEDFNEWMKKVTANSDSIDLELQKFHPTEKEKNYFHYREIISKAYKSNGISAMKYVFKSLLYTDEPIDALLWIAKNLSKTEEEEYQMYWKAFAIANVLSEEYDKSPDDDPKRWTEHWYRPYMRGKASYFTFLLETTLDENKEQEAIQKLHDMIKLDPDDPIGLRFILMNQWSHLEQYDQMEAIYKQFPADHKNPLFLYPMALMKYKTLGENHPDTASFIQKALENNLFIPVLAFKNIDVPPFESSTYLPHSEEEAQYFFEINLDFVYMEEDQSNWLYKTFLQFIENFHKQHMDIQV
jgi:hypothetical protein